jgi:hypothetical protein
VEVTFDDLPGRLDLRDPSVPTLEVSGDGTTWQAPAAVGVSEDGRTLVLTAPGKVKQVRYGWRNFCALRIFTDENLPVAPWRIFVER